ncbi:g1423 [Coccomyxa elongata]
MLQGKQPSQGQDARASRQSESQSSQASAAEGDSAEKGSRGKKLGFLGRATEKLKRWKNRTPAQQEANKAAQKRYRERKKGQVSELQAQADALAAQVKALEIVNADNVSLETSNCALEQQLSSSASPQANSGAQATTSSEWGSPEWHSFDSHFINVVEDLGKYLREKGVKPSVRDENTPPDVLAEINGRLLQAMQTCMQALNLGGLKLQRLIDAVTTRANLTAHTGMDGLTGCYRAARLLNLSEEQVRRGLQYRSHVLGVMDKIYKERDELNQRVAALLASGNDEGAQKQLPAALAQLRANLSSEMRAWSEQHFLVFRMLLSSTQGAWLLVESFPEHCDCLAFLNGLQAASPQQ